VSKLCTGAACNTLRGAGLAEPAGPAPAPGVGAAAAAASDLLSWRCELKRLYTDSEVGRCSAAIAFEAGEEEEGGELTEVGAVPHRLMKLLPAAEEEGEAESGWSPDGTCENSEGLEMECLESRCGGARWATVAAPAANRLADGGDRLYSEGLAKGCG
jgi:hypothetical protein